MYFSKCIFIAVNSTMISSSWHLLQSKILANGVLFFQMDEEAPMWGPRPARRGVQIQCPEKAVRPHRAEVAAQAYHIQVGG